MKQFSAPVLKTSSIPLKNPKRVRGGEEVGGVERQPGARDDGEGTEGEATKWQRGNKRFEDEGGAGVQDLQRGLDSTVEVYMSEEFEEKVTVLRLGTQQGSSSKSEGCQVL